jgi:hypothetical protein
MRITLRTKNGSDTLEQDLNGLTVYPDIIVYQDQPYILKRVMPDKQSAFYYEATTYAVTAGA